MGLLDGAILLAMAIIAGAINAAVGSGSLLTLPVLLALGVPPGVAVRTNTVGMLFSTVGACMGYRQEIRQELPLLRPLILTTLCAACAGSMLLLVASPAALDWVVPVLIVAALLLVILQPTIAKRLTSAHSAAGIEAHSAAGTNSHSAAGTGAHSPTEQAERLRSPGLLAAMGGASVYGGFFTAAQGVLYLGVLGAFTGRDLRSVNSIKNLLSLVVNLAATAVYLIAWAALDAPILWLGALIIGAGALLGSYTGAHLARRFPEWLMRTVIVAVALFALVRQFM